MTAERGRKSTRPTHRHYVDSDVWTLALERMDYCFDNFDNVTVMFSGGKDSTSCLHVALEVAKAKYPHKLPLDVVFFDEEAIPLQTVEYVRRVAQDQPINLRWFCLPLKHRNACSRKSPYWYPWAPEDRELWVREWPEEGIAMFPGFPEEPDMRLSHTDCNGLILPPEDYGQVAMVMGIRAQESMTRYRAVTAKKADNWLVNYSGYANRGNITKAYPIYDWNTEDVWTAPARFGWDYNRAYDVMEQAGLSRAHQRCSPAFGEEPLQKLWTYATCFPEIWDKMLLRVPGDATAARYALTDLYGYKGVAQKPPDVSWVDWLLHFAAKFDDEHKTDVAERIRGLIRNHYAKTSDPILENAAHPDTGISYTWLLMVAMRGDFKNRKLAGTKFTDTSPEGYAKYRAAYESELAEYLAAERARRETRDVAV